MSNLSAFPYITERAPAVPALWNDVYSILSANIKAVADGPFTSSSTNTLSFSTNIEVVGGGHFQQLSIGSTPPSAVTTAAITIAVNSAFSDYLYLTDSSGARSNYVIGSRAGGTADGLNIWDASGATMIASFSKQSIRFYQNVVGPVFDVGGALASTLNAATFGTGTDSKESRIQAAISAASTQQLKRVYIPANMYPYSAGSISFSTFVQMVREGGDWSVLDVRAYGAFGDSFAHDDSAAIQGAVDFASNNSGGKVYFPDGVYHHTQTIAIPAGAHSVALIGAVPWGLDSGTTGTRIVYSGSSDAVRVGSPAVLTNNFTLENLAILLTSAGTRASGLNLRNVHPFSLLRPRIAGIVSGGSQVLINLDGTGIFTGLGVIDNPWLSNGSIAIRYAGTGTQASNAIVVLGGTVSGGVGSKGLVFEGDANGNFIYGTDIEGWSVGVEIRSHHIYVDARFESNTTDIRFTSTAARNRASGVLSNTSSIQDDAPTGANSYFLPDQAIFQRSLWQLRNTSDVGSYFIITSGSASDQEEGILLRDRLEANRWFLQKTSGNAFALTHSPSGVDVLNVTSSGSTIALGANVRFSDMSINGLLSVIGTGTVTARGTGTFVGVSAVSGSVPSGDGVLYSNSAYMDILRSFNWSTVTLFTGTTLSTTAGKVSIRTTTSLDSTTMAKGEMAFSLAPGSSGASLAIQSGSTIYYFSSSNSTKAP